MTKDRKKAGVNNIVSECYNQENDTDIGHDMNKPGRKTKKETPDNLFNTWLAYRETTSSRADIIREVSAKLERKYDNDRFYKWSKQILGCPQGVYDHCIYPEMAEVLEFYFDKIGYKLPKLKVDALATLITDPRNPEILKLFFKGCGNSTSGIDFQALADAIRPANKIV